MKQPKKLLKVGKSIIMVSIKSRKIFLDQFATRELEEEKRRGKKKEGCKKVINAHDIE